MIFLNFSASGTPPTSMGNGTESLNALEMTRLALWKMYNQAGGNSNNNGSSPVADLTRPPVSLPSLPTLPNLPSLPHDLFAQDKAGAAAAAAAAGLNLHFAERQRALEEATKGEDDRERRGKSEEREEAENGLAEAAMERLRERIRPREEDDRDVAEESPVKKSAKIDVEELNGNDLEEDEQALKDKDEDDIEAVAEVPSPRKAIKEVLGGGLPGANIKITSRGEINTENVLKKLHFLQINYRTTLINFY